MKTEELKRLSCEPVEFKVKEKRTLLGFSRKQLCIPYGVFLACFVVLPLLLIVFYAFTDQQGGFTFDNFIRFFTSATTLTTVIISILIALATTVICLLIAYPVAYILANSKLNKGGTLLMLFIMPMWINFVLRAMAMKDLLTLIGVFEFNNYLNVIIGMVYDYMPFMVMPIYTVLMKMDKSLIEASKDLGATGVQTFTKVVFPLSMPGIASGITMVFMPTMTCYVISDTFGNGLITIIGKLIDEQFTTFSNWNFGSAMAMVLLVIMLISMWVTGGFKSEETRGTNL
ncbi:MAG: ABC transporter permease [Clostridia bacterium]|nr:ABC transporter permease [Clostridia bacterium]